MVCGLLKAFESHRSRVKGSAWEGELKEKSEKNPSRVHRAPTSIAIKFLVALITYRYWFLPQGSPSTSVTQHSPPHLLRPSPTSSWTWSPSLPPPPPSPPLHAQGFLCSSHPTSLPALLQLAARTLTCRLAALQGDASPLCGEKARCWALRHLGAAILCVPALWVLARHGHHLGWRAIGNGAVQPSVILRG